LEKPQFLKPAKVMRNRDLAPAEDGNGVAVEASKENT